MGRVSRYKKQKTFDLFGDKKYSDDKFDRPPTKDDLEDFNAESKYMRRGSDRAVKAVEDFVLRNKEYIEKLESVGNSTEGAKQKAITPKQKEETMKQFKKRVREETQQIMVDDAKSRSKTVKKRKSYLKEKKRLKKANKNGGRPLSHQEEYEEVDQYIHGLIQTKTDETAPSFGDRYDAPPRFQGTSAARAFQARRPGKDRPPTDGSNSSNDKGGSNSKKAKAQSLHFVQRLQKEQKQKQKQKRVETVDMERQRILAQTMYKNAKKRKREGGLGDFGHSSSSADGLTL